MPCSFRSEVFDLLHKLESNFNSFLQLRCRIRGYCGGGSGSLTPFIKIIGVFSELNPSLSERTLVSTVSSFNSVNFLNWFYKSSFYYDFVGIFLSLPLALIHPCMHWNLNSLKYWVVIVGIIALHHNPLLNHLARHL